MSIPAGNLLCLFATLLGLVGVLSVVVVGLAFNDGILLKLITDDLPVVVLAATAFVTATAVVDRLVVVWRCVVVAGVVLL